LASRTSPALLVGIAGVVVGAAAIPASSFRTLSIVVAASLIVIAVLLAAIGSLASTELKLEGVILSGTVGRFARDSSLWVFWDGYEDGKLAWIFGGEVSVIKRTFRFNTQPHQGQPEATVVVVRANALAYRQLREIRDAPEQSGRRKCVYNPPLPGCKILGKVDLQPG
jgi:hypothetical protein